MQILMQHTNMKNIIHYKVPAARVLSSPSGEAAEDNVEERENSEVTQFFGWAGDGDGRRRTDEDGRTTEGQTEFSWQILY